MEFPLISVIVPIYKVEKYLDKCIRSIVEQTYKNLEIILVDDGSPDRCGEIAESWAEKDSRILYLKKANGGLSSARNYGIDNSHGEFLAFVDSDDYIAPSMYEELYRAIIDNAADVAVCDCYEIYEDGSPYLANSHRPLLPYACYSREEYLKRLFKNISSLNYGVAWNKLYKATLFEEIRYPVGKINEDQFIIHYIVHKATKIVTINKKLYYYVQRPSSIMGSIKQNPKAICGIEAYEDRQKFLTDNNYSEALRDRLKLETVKYAMFLYVRLKYCGESSEEMTNSLNYLMSIIVKYKDFLLSNKTVPIQYKIHIRVFLKAPYLWYCYIVLSNSIKRIIKY